MRLLNTLTLALEDFNGAVSFYVALSHTWGSEKVSFQDVLQQRAEQLQGYTKIVECCAEAVLDGFKYVWIDICCIDKTSSAELSEAINSMYAWYQNAEVCYAFLADVPEDEDHFYSNSAFRNSRWFTRGWILQELLAPLSVVFYDQEWAELGTRSSLRYLISDITGIYADVLQHNDMGTISIATKMSWASQRVTTRVKDIAYCLMGLFGVKMPTIYGEGSNAFMRLQHMILQSSDDHTIFTVRDPLHYFYSGNPART